MKYLANTHDPSDVERAKRKLTASFHKMHDPDWREKAWQRHLQYLSDKIIGELQSWHDHSDEELVSMAKLVPSYMLDGQGTILEQMKRFQATCPTKADLIAQKTVGVYVND